MANSEYGLSVILRLVDKLSGPMKQVEKTFDNMQNAYQKHGKSLRDVGGKMSLYVTAPLVGMGALAANTAVSFESAFTGVRKTVNATEAELQTLRTGFEQMTTQIPLSFEEISKIGEAAGQLGIQTPNIMGFTKVMADLGVTTNLSSEEAATQLARFANITQMSQKDFDRLGSTIAELGNNLATTESEITAMGMRLAAAGKQVGFSEAQTMGLAAALSSLGLEAEAGGTAFSRVLIEMDKAMVKPSKNTQIFAKVAGMSVSQFKKLYKEDAVGALQAFSGGLNKLGQRSTLVFEAMGLDGVRTADAMRRVAGSGTLLHDAMKLGTGAWAENNALQREAALRYGTSASQMKLFWNELRIVGKEFGEIIIPVLRRFLDAARPVLRWMQSMSPFTKTLIVGLAGIAAALGPLIGGIGVLTGSMAALGVASSPVLATMAGIGAAIGVIVAGVLALEKAWSNLKKGDVMGSTTYGLIQNAIMGKASPAPTGGPANLTVPGLMKSATEITLRVLGDKATAVQAVDKKKGDANVNVISQGYLGLAMAQ